MRSSLLSEINSKNYFWVYVNEQHSIHFPYLVHGRWYKLLVLRLHTRCTIRHSLNRWRNQLSAYLTRNRRFVLTISVPYPLATIEHRYNEEEEIRGGVRQLPGIRRGPVNSAVFVAAMRKRSPLSTPVTHPSDNT